MSFFASWAMRDPSTNSTKEWISDCGWTTTSICSPGRPKRKWASMTSRPLFIMVAESIVIFGPIFHVGCARASSTVIASNVSRRRSRNGPPDAVRTSRRASSGPAAAHGLVDRAVLGIHGDQLGSALPGFVEDELAGDDQRLLVGEGEPLSRADRGVRRAQAQRADEPSHDGIGLRVAGGLHQAFGARDDAALRARGQQPFEPRDVLGAIDGHELRTRTRATCSASFSIERPAASATTRNRSGKAATTSSVERPIEPVDPRMERVFMCLFRRGGTRCPARSLPAFYRPVPTKAARTGAAKSRESIRS